MKKYVLLCLCSFFFVSVCVLASMHLANHIKSLQVCVCVCVRIWYCV